MSKKLDVFLDPKTCSVVPTDGASASGALQLTSTDADAILWHSFLTKNIDLAVTAVTLANRQVKATKGEDPTMCTTFCNLSASSAEFFLSLLGNSTFEDMFKFFKALNASRAVEQIKDDGDEKKKTVDVKQMHNRTASFLVFLMEKRDFNPRIPALLYKATLAAIQSDEIAMSRDGDTITNASINDLTTDFLSAVLSNDAVAAIAAGVRVFMRFHRSLRKGNTYGVEIEKGSTRDKLRKSVIQNWLLAALHLKDASTPDTRKFIVSVVGFMTLLKGDWLLGFVLGCMFLARERTAIVEFAIDKDAPVIDVDKKQVLRVFDRLEELDTNSDVVGGHGLEDTVLPEGAFTSNTDLGALHLSRNLASDVAKFVTPYMPKEKQEREVVQAFEEGMVKNGTVYDLMRTHLAKYGLVASGKKSSGVSKGGGGKAVAVKEIPLVTPEDFNLTDDISVEDVKYLDPPTKRMEEFLFKLSIGDRSFYYVGMRGLNPSTKKSLSNVTTAMDSARETYGLAAKQVLFVEDAETLFYALNTADTEADVILETNPKYTAGGEPVEFVQREAWCSEELVSMSDRLKAEGESWGTNILLSILSNLAFRALHSITARGLDDLYLVGDEVVMAPDVGKGTVNIDSTAPWHTVLFSSTKTPPNDFLQRLNGQVDALTAIVQGWKDDMSKWMMDTSADDEEGNNWVCGVVSKDTLLTRMELLLMCLKSNTDWVPPVKAKKAASKTKKATASKNKKTSVRARKVTLEPAVGLSAALTGSKSKAKGGDEGSDVSSVSSASTPNTSDLDLSEDEEDKATTKPVKATKVAIRKPTAIPVKKRSKVDSTTAKKPKGKRQRVGFADDVSDMIG